MDEQDEQNKGVWVFEHGTEESPKHIETQFAELRIAKLELS
jgi:hypothetical protein